MSGFSGPTHQGLVGDGHVDVKKKSTSNKPKEDDLELSNVDESGLDNITNRKQIDTGMEELVMTAAHDQIFTNAHDSKHQDIINAVRKELIAFSAANGNSELAEQYLDDGMESFAQFKETMGKVIKKITQITMVILSTTKDSLKKISGRLNRLSVRNTMLRRRVQNADDKLALSDEIPLPETHPYITIKGRSPKTANDVSDAVLKMKDFFVCAHNTNAAFHTAFTDAINNGTRDDSIYGIKQYLGLLANRVSAKADNTSRLVYDNIPAGYGMVIDIGNSFSDCSASVTRVHSQEVTSPATQRGDKAALLRILDNNEQFLKNINEVYGRISSRLDNEFRKNIRNAENKLRTTEDYDTRAMSATLEWYGDNQNKIFTKSMQMSCSVLAASMDYIHNNVVKAGAGNEDLLSEDASNDDLNTDEDYAVDVEEPDVDEGRVGLAIAEVHARVLSAIPAEVMRIDASMAKVIDHTISGTPLIIANSLHTFDALWNITDHGDNQLIDVAEQILSLRNGLDRLINTRHESYSYGKLERDVVCNESKYRGGRLMCDHNSTVLDYHQFTRRITTQAIKPCEDVYEILKTHLQMLSDSFNREDIMLSNLIDKLTNVGNTLWNKSYLLTGHHTVVRGSKSYGDITLPYHAVVVSEFIKTNEVATQVVPDNVDLRFEIDRCVKLYNQFGALYGEYTDLYEQVDKVFKIIVSSLLTTSDRGWVNGAFTYLSILIGTIRWLTSLHNDTMDYLLVLSKQMLTKHKVIPISE